MFLFMPVLVNFLGLWIVNGLLLVLIGWHICHLWYKSNAVHTYYILWPWIWGSFIGVSGKTENTFLELFLLNNYYWGVDRESFVANQVSISTFIETVLDSLTSYQSNSSTFSHRTVLLIRQIKWEVRTNTKLVNI